MYKICLMWFRQDLRVYDNTALYYAIKKSIKIIPIFILDKNIIQDFGGLKDQKFKFISEALSNLSREIKEKGGEKLNIFYTKPEEIIPKIVQKYRITCVFTNTAYDIYGKERDEKIIKILEEINCDFESHKDFLLVEPWETEVRKVFTPYYKLWKEKIPNTEEKSIGKINQQKIEEKTNIEEILGKEKHPVFTINFGQKRVNNFIIHEYELQKNNLDYGGVSKLSPYHRFGIFSIREIYNNAKNISENFISELAWREFWHQILYNFPNTKNEEFLEKRKNIKWSKNSEHFERWCNGETGYPIIDAAMKQLNKENRIHGRNRMIVASFLTKDLHIDRKEGEKYFKEKLLDYVDSINIGNWQWCASVGADPKPLRIFNPILQSKKFDKNAKYIKKRIPKLENEELKNIHNPIENNIKGYIKPIVNHNIERKVAIRLYNEAKIKNNLKN